MRSWLRRSAMLLAVSAFLAGGLGTVGASPAAAEASTLSGECLYDGQKYSEGAVIHIRDDVYIICKKGKWETWTPPTPEPPEPDPEPEG
jgi:hypothetical protein